MIPKEIHYCWFGNKEKTNLAKKCINSWKTVLKDYKIQEWNEKNFDVTQNEYTKYCYENEKWAFLSDYARLKIIYENGGIYFDTDVEVLASFDDLLKYTAFFGREGKYINTGLGFGAEKNNSLIKDIMQSYEKIIPTENYSFIPCPRLNTPFFKDYGFNVDTDNIEEKNNIIVLTSTILNPFDDQTGVLNKTTYTKSIHWYGKSWMSLKSKVRNKITRKLHKYLGVDFFRKH